MSEWIDCKTRLPDNEFPCLVTYREPNLFTGDWGEKNITILSYIPDYKIWNIKSPVKVEAWMPLPEPYEEKE